MEPWYRPQGVSCPAHRILVPWRDELEWDEVCRGLFAAPESDQWHKAQLIVAAWRARTVLPPAVEALVDTTACQHRLIAAYTSQNGSTDSRRFSDDLLRNQRLASALALSRAVSLLTDRVQQRQKYAQSVGTLADVLGIPALLVEVRHATVHQTLPSVATLLEAHSEWMSFLQSRYLVRRKCAIERYLREIQAQISLWFAKRPIQATLSETVAAAAAADSFTPASCQVSNETSTHKLNDAFLRSLAYVEVRWLALDIAEQLSSHANELLAATASAAFRQHLHDWLGQLHPVFERWPHFLPSLVAALVTKTTVAPQTIHRAYAEMILALLEALHPSEPTKALGPWAILHECFWLEWLLHTQLSQQDARLSRYCRSWIERGRAQLRMCAARPWLNNMAPVEWQIGVLPHWEPRFGIQHGAWRRCQAWPTCPIGVLPAGYDGSAVHRFETHPISGKPGHVVVLEKRERALIDRLVQRTHRVLGDATSYANLDHILGSECDLDGVLVQADAPDHNSDDHELPLK
ncbi:Las1-like [Cyanidiococcus yangmingshanensis]|uniref:Las1-like n=1 Tax=Cyanidiococcus yangmingshanensis TaxID=2690220 RepID=A0A7J7IFQ9_9RHOD|nr:Las1-like [Cyanidiococcus yangmingshanensis]